MLRTVKQITLRAAEATGLSSVVRSSEWRRRRLLILCYHGVSTADEHEWSELYVTQDHLRKRFEHLRRRGYNVLRLSEGMNMLRTGTLPDKSVVITFDDGARDFITRAYPLLQQFGFHATLYLTTFYCLYQRPVFDTVSSYILWKGRGQTVRLPHVTDGPVRIPMDNAARSALHIDLRRYVNEQRWTAQQKDELARSLAEHLRVDFGRILDERILHLLAPEEVRSLSPQFVSVQLHTHRHRVPRDERLFVRELTDNRDAILAMRPLGESLDHFCYPSGEYDPLFLPWLKAAGVVSATTCDPGIVCPETNPLLLPRLIDTLRTPDEVFEGWLSGVAAFLPRRGS